MPVPFLDLKRQYDELATELTPALMRIISGGTYILGGEVEAFEREWADFCHAQSAAAVGNGTDALALALIASGAVRQGERDEVITSTLTSAYTALAILNAGGVPVFADINPVSYTIDPESIEEVITPRTCAIVPVHIYGQMADMRAILDIARRHDLIVIEDAAQAHGAFLDANSRGIYADAAAYSFYPTKNLGAFGDGGAVVSDDVALIERVKTLRQGGHPLALAGSTEGRNSRLDELQAAILRVKLRRLLEWNYRRRNWAAIYKDLLAHDYLQIRVPTVTAKESHVFHLYVIQHPERDDLHAHLSERGVETLIHYPYLLHQQPLFQSERARPLPIAERIVGSILSLPLYPQLKRDEVHAVVSLIHDFEMDR